MRRSHRCTLVFSAALLCGWNSFAQPKDAGARELYYFSASPTKESLPPIKTAATRPRPPQPQPQPQQQQPAEETIPPSAVKNLGFRYSLSLMSGPDQFEPVDTDRNFRRGECFVINFEANRSGYLYVLAKQSDGTWFPLLPNAEIPDKNVADPGQKMRVPAQTCINIDDPPGTETLFIVLSRDPRDVYELNEAIKNSVASQSQPAAPSRKGSDPTQMASARLNNAVDAFSKFTGSRNLSFQKVAEQPKDPREMPYSRYVVSSWDQPVTKVVAQIEIQHR